MRSFALNSVAVCLLSTRATTALSARAWLSGRGSPAPPPLIIGGALPEPPASPLELPLLALGPDPLLPGEAQTRALSDPTARLLVEYAASKTSSCCGQLMLRGEDEVVGISGLLELEACEDEEGGATLVSIRCVGRVGVLGLSQPDEARLPGGEGGFLVALVEPYCDDDEDADAEREAMEDALSAAAEDGPAGAAGISEAEVVGQARELLRSLEGEVRESHARVAALRARLWDALRAKSCPVGDDVPLPEETTRDSAEAAGGGGEGGDGKGDGGSNGGEGDGEGEGEGEAARLREELRSLGDERAAPLAALIEARRAVLRSSHDAPPPLSAGSRAPLVAGPPAPLSDLEASARAAWMAKQGLPEGKAASSADEPLGETLAELWGLPPGSGACRSRCCAFHREQAAERQLLSFAAAATLGPQIRAHALTCTSATGRLSAALCALRQQERRLAAILTLRNSGLRAD
ncbi:hypothetical protein EMIHUDRAFT_106783 [Emiliania huxleyi CCMP1516]|uniref:Lon N-terminal domain-containing protein n=2 Tax=Emiliania huxleyi TaxID=2903 RepID=A0A0D3I5L3_EMIH1|nr:hypothetical protein EMIHUDRAFT_106783 [Emiliania huxleyi CCMP1516]EOD06548.1 hypothetical protein EMIHUDRAFT_106783 [Emiliania huxleyi CCMP1516]|eukprot:XP_005758977.1 hypothetical protein EMIHUDRAFT_106783 [Emiliania huxleyi CCMP1516]